MPTVEMRPYLDWLIQRITSAGGVLLRRRIDRLADVADLAPIVVHATGLAAGALASDSSVHPVRGQIVLVSNPGLSVSVRDEDNPAGATYIHPRSHDVVLGGTFEPNASDCLPNADVARQIVERCAALVPELGDARIQSHLVGLRPGRHGGIRVYVPGSPRLVRRGVKPKRHCFLLGGKR